MAMDLSNTKRFRCIMSATSDHPCHEPVERAIFVAAPIEILAASLADPARMAQWMGDEAMPVSVEHEGRAGGSIVVRGRQHVPFENRGRILRWDPPRRFSWTHLSTLSNLPDEPASYTTLDFALEPTRGGTMLSFTMHGFPTLVIRKHLVLYWRVTLDVIRCQAEADV
ncbi:MULTISPECIES: SRPBCC domain-containing protein [unclassified Burkholderia]|uniref:SRPBCC family protein n=1 Tax=unclassified Burkholderia TaxID=2613784 RepID=UPI00158EA99E|nr:MULTISPECIES: SRPBCC domain-containing protein [unclassified Burkholderia]